LRYFVRLPHALRRSEAHEIGVCLAVPPGQPFRPRYVFTPLLRCDEFDLRVRFGSRMAGLPVCHVTDRHRPGDAYGWSPDQLIHRQTYIDLIRALPRWLRLHSGT
jgi:hypothetical protein